MVHYFITCFLKDDNTSLANVYFNILNVRVGPLGSLQILRYGLI